MSCTLIQSVKLSPGSLRRLCLDDIVREEGRSEGNKLQSHKHISLLFFLSLLLFISISLKTHFFPPPPPPLLFVCRGWRVVCFFSPFSLLPDLLLLSVFRLLPFHLFLFYLTLIFIPVPKSMS